MTKQHLPKVLAPSDAGAFVFRVVAFTDIIGGTPSRLSTRRNY